MKRCRLSTSCGMHFTASGITLLRQINNHLEALIPPRALSVEAPNQVFQNRFVETGHRLDFDRDGGAAFSAFRERN